MTKHRLKAISTARLWKRLVILTVLVVLTTTTFISPVLAIDPPGPAIRGESKEESREEASVQPTNALENQIQQTLLQDRFGVSLGLQPGAGVFPFSFDWASMAPTLNTDTVDWIEADWYGDWNTSNVIIGTTYRGNVPSGGEWYDVEALYFDNDQSNFYIAIVTSVPHFEDWGGGNLGVGIYDSRVLGGVWTRPGDLSIDLGLNAPRVERNGTTWRYDFGVDIVHENRDSIATTVSMRDNALGASLYRTANDAGGVDVENPIDSDWYTSAPGINAAAYWESTNFDPESTISTNLGAIQYVGETTVSYYEYDFGGALENGAPTYVVEVTIPRALFGDANPGHGDTIGIRWVEGCRNDGNNTQAVIYLDGDVDDIETGDAPDSTNHFGTQMTYNGDPTNPVLGNFPTVSDPKYAGSAAPYGMCHIVCPTCSYLGAGVSAERDADLLPDEDVPAISPLPNLSPLLDIPDADSDDGLRIPSRWQDGVQDTIRYTVTVPTGAAPGTRYVNIWFDWNRDGDWADSNVACATAHTENERVLANQPVNVTPGSTAGFDVALNPCNPNGDLEILWVRITVSNEAVSDVDADGRGPGYCFREGETEDWLHRPLPPTAVELLSFTAKSRLQAIVVKWETASEIDNIGFNLYRSQTVEGPWIQLNDHLIPSQVPPGSPVGAVYKFRDTAVEPGVLYYYLLEDVDIRGVTTSHGPASARFNPRLRE